ncbi:MAG: L-2-hydroxyglutarate oxidase [Geminocystis sp.]|nr:L-2-hydroxyglutarate oxidase [Geminocystis sp.]
MRLSTDFLVIGSGIVGLAISRALLENFPRSKIIVIDKESSYGVHASGRNSGVLHAGFYYHPDSLKARFTREGNQELRSYCEERGLRISKCGKVVVASSEEELETLYELKRRGDINGVELYLIDEQELRKIEPVAKTYKQAIWSPNTAVVDPFEILKSLVEDLKNAGVNFYYNTPYRARLKKNIVLAGGYEIEYGMLINCAGLYADKIAKDFGFSQNYVLVPFKGLYLEYTGNIPFITRNIYPVPNIRNPFLGVHFTVKVDNTIKIGPTATPCLWRENYDGFRGFNLGEFLEIATWISKLFVKNSLFRSTAFQEVKKYLKSSLLNDASKLIQGIELKPEEWSWAKPGIRAQLVDTKKLQLVQDFVIEGDKESVHILNAVSPAFTASLPFARYVVKNYINGGFHGQIQEN